jgi:hypothetical protein
MRNILATKSQKDKRPATREDANSKALSATVRSAALSGWVQQSARSYHECERIGWFHYSIFFQLLYFVFVF